MAVTLDRHGYATCDSRFNPPEGCEEYQICEFCNSDDLPCDCMRARVKRWRTDIEAWDKRVLTHWAQNGDDAPLTENLRVTKPNPLAYGLDSSWEWK